MKLTKTQFRQLLNQHTGTGYMLVKMDNRTIRIVDLHIGRDGKWYMGLDGKPMEQGLKDIEQDLIYEA